MIQAEYRSSFGVSREELFAWHGRAGALERLLPPWQDVRVVSAGRGVANGSIVTLSVPAGPARVTWVARHFEVDPPRQFRDEQVSGPFHTWIHTHRFESVGAGSELVDHIDYELPMGEVGRFFGGRPIQGVLDQMFRFRHQRTQNDLARHELTHGKAPLRILISGASGLLGAQLRPFLTTGGHTVHTLVRGAARAADEISWNPSAWELDAKALEGFDAVIHLSGQNLAGGRWTPAMKDKILTSRTQTTRLLCERLASLERPPGVLVSASAIGYYGNRGVEPMTEDSAAGEGFLADVCRQWEAATEAAEKADIRVVKPRIGAVLSARGGMLQKLLTPFKLGLGGRIGSGEQMISWIAIDDLLGIIHQAIFDERLRGPVNATSPNAVSNLEFVQTLGKVLKRPTAAPLPAAAVKVMFGQMGEEVLLSGSRVVPAKLKGIGFGYDFPGLEEALRWELGKGE